MEKVFAKKLGFLPDKGSEFLILDKVELRGGVERVDRRAVWSNTSTNSRDNF
ncbi:MAG: hypothetical protein V7K90_07210 [Nostoc sp.]